MIIIFLFLYGNHTPPTKKGKKKNTIYTATFENHQIITKIQVKKNNIYISQQISSSLPCPLSTVLSVVSMLWLNFTPGKMWYCPLFCFMIVLW